MKRLLLLTVLLIASVSAFAQFPLGSNRQQIKAYFAANVPYSLVQEFKDENGTQALCFTKVKVLGDYTFYFNDNGICTSYVVTYDKNEISEVTNRFDNKFCKLDDTKWESEEGIYKVKLVLPKGGENYFSVVYNPMSPVTLRPNVLASN